MSRWFFFCCVHSMILSVMAFTRSTPCNRLLLPCTRRTACHQWSLVNVVLNGRRAANPLIKFSWGWCPSQHAQFITTDSTLCLKLIGDIVLDEELCGGEHEDDDDDNPLDHSSNSGFSKPVFKRFMARRSMFPFLPASCNAINNGFVSMFLSMFLSMFPAMFPSTFLSMLLSMFVSSFTLLPAAWGTFSRNSSSQILSSPSFFLLFSVRVTPLYRKVKQKQKFYFSIIIH